MQRHRFYFVVSIKLGLNFCHKSLKLGPRIVRIQTVKLGASKNFPAAHTYHPT